MTLEQEFQKQWASLCNYVKSEILKFNSGNIDPNRIQSIIESEKKKWFLPGQYNNAWFELLKRTNPDTAQKFEEKLKQIKIEPVAINQNKSMLILLGLAAAGAAVGFGASRIFKATIIPTVLLTAGGAVIGLFIGSILNSKKKKDTFNKSCTAYMEQLTKAGEILSQIVSQAD